VLVWIISRPDYSRIVDGAAEGGKTVKVIVDHDLCEANAICQRSCPEAFRVEEDDTLTVLMTEIPERLHKEVEEAVRLCPRQALRLEG